jgi:citrate lyase subunit beta/citryl-CoA lyase/(S)-citramalyl-CoA lyase
LLTVRQQLILACAENSIPAIDVPFIRLEDEAGLVEECIKAERFGFAAKAAIHPRQIGAIESAFTPSEDAVSEAREALRAYAEAGERAIRYNGRMLEAPLVKKFRAIIARSEGKQNA